MTLLEVMMAVAVFGIILVFVTQMTNTSSRLTADNMNQVEMMELAQAEAERIRYFYDKKPEDLDLYLRKDEEVKGYKVNEEKPEDRELEQGYLIIITVSSINNEQENFVLVTWLPPM
jgi:prepilin-type N-terminal cleavage/methylation domain-containing protein